MKRKTLCSLLIAMLLMLSAPQQSKAYTTADSWIFRSDVAPGQGMWGTGPSTGYNFNDNYLFQAGIFKAGFEWELQADPGTVIGNVEGNITAQYDRIVNKLGKTPVSLSYAGINDESQIRTSLGVKLTGKPYIGINLPWPIPDINVDLGLQFVDVSLDSKKDFTTGLDSTVYDSGRYDILPFNADIGIISGDLNFFLDNDISFMPQTFEGTMKYTHLATQTVKKVDVTFNSDSDELVLEADLDKPGLWEFSLEDFELTDNVFTQDLDLALELAIGIPILSAEVSAEIDTIFDFGERKFALDFLTHGYDGDGLTADRLGRWTVYVSPVPVPGAVWLLGSGLVGLLGLRRRKA